MSVDCRLLLGVARPAQGQEVHEMPVHAPIGLFEVGYHSLWPEPCVPYTYCKPPSFLGCQHTRATAISSHSMSCPSTPHREAIKPRRAMILSRVVPVP